MFMNLELSVDLPWNDFALVFLMCNRWCIGDDFMISPAKNVEAGLESNRESVTVA